MRNVPLMSLADIAESVRYGYTASASDSEVGPKFLRITDIVPPQIDWANVPYCEIDEKNHAKFSIEPGDIVIARTGATVGYAKLIRDNDPSVFASYLVRIQDTLLLSVSMMCHKGYIKLGEYQKCSRCIEPFQVVKRQKYIFTSAIKKNTTLISSQNS